MTVIDFLFQKELKHYSFLPFVGFLTIFWIFTYFKVPETKNKTIEEITRQFRTQEEDPLVQYQQLDPNKLYSSED